MSTNSRHSKITLPTVQSCSWRSHRAGTEADCGLIASLLGSRDDCGVSMEQCTACCESFPPTPNRFNPVVASLLYTRLTPSKACDSSSEYSPDLVEGLLKRAKQALQDEQVAASTGQPLRSIQPCCFLGAPSSGSGEEGFDQQYACNHPQHQVTNFSECQRCHDWSLTTQRTRQMPLCDIVPASPSRKAIDYWAVGVTTSPRSVPTLEACLQGIRRAGWDEIHLFLDGSVRVPEEFCHLPTTWREQRIGACSAWYLSLAEMVALHPEADAYALFQDDAFPHFGAPLRRYLESCLWPTQGSALVSLFNPGIHPICGWHRLPSDWDWGSLATIFPAATARQFLSDSVVARRALPRQTREHRPIPDLIREWTHRRGIEVWCPFPSLVQHIGGASTIWPHAGMGRNRIAPWFSADVEQPLVDGEDLSDFPEASFACSPADESRYQTVMQNGRRRMSESTVAICGIARDVASLVPRTMARIARLGAMFADFRVIVVENDSTDSTLTWLRQWQNATSRVKVISDRIGAKKFPQTRCLERAEALASYRNKYLEELAEDPSEWTHVIVVDMDLVSGWSYDGIANSFGHDHWDFVGSYGLDYQPTPPQQPPRRWHYDRWALRMSRDSPAGVLLKPREDLLRRGMPLLKVDSCFGGLGIYRRECLRECRYGGTDCEHVVLHSEMQKAGFDGLFLNPSQIVLRSAIAP